MENSFASHCVVKQTPKSLWVNRVGIAFGLVQMTQMMKHFKKGKPTVLTFFMGAYISDFMSALYHRFIDTTFDNPKLKELTYIASKYYLSDSHHTLPQNVQNFKIGQHIITYGPGTELSFMFVSLFCPPSLKTSLYFWSLLVPFSHAWAHKRNHKKKLPGIVEILQDNYLLLAPEIHRKHHNDETYLSTNYGTLNGWSNALTNKLFRFFDKKGVANTGFASSNIMLNQDYSEKCERLFKEGFLVAYDDNDNEIPCPRR